MTDGAHHKPTLAVEAFERGMSVHHVMQQRCARCGNLLGTSRIVINHRQMHQPCVTRADLAEAATMQPRHAQHV